MHETAAELHALQRLLDRSAHRPRPATSRARPVVSTTHADGERLAVFTHGSVDDITPGHPDFAGYDAHLTAYYGSSPMSWGPSTVFLRVEPTWMVGYAMDAATFPENPPP